jgi:hypothetical protein
MPRAISKCPECGSTVSQFAAGCAVCGADLEAARAKLASRREIPLPRPTLPGGKLRVDWVHLVIALILAVAAPPIGFLLSLYWAFQRRRTREPVMMFAMLAIAAISAAALLAPVWFWSHILKL